MEDKNIKQNSKSKRKAVFKYVFLCLVIAIVTILAFYYILKDDPVAIWNSIVGAKFGYIILMIAMAIMAMLFEGLAITILTKSYNKHYKYYQGVLNGTIGSLFSAITPSSSGGQFAQAYTFSRQGVKASNSASVLVMLFIVSQIVVIVYGVFAMIFGYSSTILKMDNINIFNLELSPIVFSVIGFVINIFVLLIILLLAYLKPLHRFILSKGVNFLYKIHLIKDPKRKRIEIASSVASFRIELTRLFKSPYLLISILLVEILKFSCTYSLPFIAGLALGKDIDTSFVNISTYMTCLWSSSYQNMITGFIPIPGSSGVAEGAFQILFSSIYNDYSITSAANILTRGVSFYFTLFVGFIVFISYGGSPKQSKQSYSSLQKTFVDLKIVSMAVNENDTPVLKEMTNTSIKPGIISSTVDKFNTILSQQQTKAKDEALKYITAEQLEESFKHIKETLIDNKDVEKYEPSSNLNVHQALQEVYKDLENIEADIKESKKIDTQVQLAIKEDLEAIDKSKIRKLEKKKKRLLKKEMKKQKKEQ